MNSTWLKSIWSIISLVSSGKLVKNKIWLGGASMTGPPTAAWAGTAGPPEKVKQSFDQEFDWEAFRFEPLKY